MLKCSTYWREPVKVHCVVYRLPIFKIQKKSSHKNVPENASMNSFSLTVKKET